MVDLPEILQDNLQKLDGWTISSDCKKIQKHLIFNDFKGAFAFIIQVAFLAEKMNHHPTWINTFTSVLIKLTTHETQSITEKDILLAQQINKL